MHLRAARDHLDRHYASDLDLDTLQHSWRRYALPAGARISVVADDGTVLFVQFGRAFHSIYFEMLGEQGWPGLSLWLLVNLIGLARMEVLRRRYKEGAFAWAGSLAAGLQSAHVVYLFGAAFIAVAFQSFVYMLIGAQIGLDTYLARRRAEETAPGIVRRSRAQAVPA